MNYEIKFHPDALREFCELDGSLKKFVKKQLDKLKTSPFLGEELGNKNGYDLIRCCAGCEIYFAAMHELY